MTNFKRVLISAFLLSVSLGFSGCGKMNVKENPREQVVGDIIFKDDGKGGISVEGRGGEKFKQCERDCEILTQPVALQDIQVTSVSVGRQSQAPATIITYTNKTTAQARSAKVASLDADLLSSDSEQPISLNALLLSQRTGQFCSVGPDNCCLSLFVVAPGFKGFLNHPADADCKK